MLRKMLSEFSHELLLTPVLVSENQSLSTYQITSDNGEIAYSFESRLLALDHWDISPESIKKTVNGICTPFDALDFLIEFNESLGFNEDNFGTYIEEIISCLHGMAYMFRYNTTSVKELIYADYQNIEHAMIAGHPCFIANSAKIGFDSADYQNYAPEAAEPLSLIWLAGHKSQTEFSSIAPFNYEQLLEQELEVEIREKFNRTLADKGLNHQEYIYFPAHPWQWYNKLSHAFAADLANNVLVCLGDSEDKYLPQQSVRTFFNVSTQSRFYVKTALSILNMGFMRGLSAYFMRTTPAINKWVYDLVNNDAYLQRKDFTILREIATSGYTNTYFEEALQTDTPYKKMLASLWRESPFQYIKPAQKLMTMAALLHVDVYDNALLPELIKASGMNASVWIERYLDCYLSPLLHCYYQHDTRFMPHGENVILVLENHVPVKAIMKDIGEEVAVISPEKILPPDVERIRIPVPEELKILSIFTQAFDCFFRHLNQILVSYADFPEDKFWELVADCILAYQKEFPELEEKYKKYCLFAPTIPKTCLNRLQIRNHKKMIDGSNPFKNQQFAGDLMNPLTKHRDKVLATDKVLT